MYCRCWLGAVGTVGAEQVPRCWAGAEVPECWVSALTPLLISVRNSGNWVETELHGILFDSGIGWNSRNSLQLRPHSTLEIPYRNCFPPSPSPSHPLFRKTKVLSSSLWCYRTPNRCCCRKLLAKHGSEELIFHWYQVLFCKTKVLSSSLWYYRTPNRCCSRKLLAKHGSEELLFHWYQVLFRKTKVLSSSLWCYRTPHRCCYRKLPGKHGSEELLFHLYQVLFRERKVLSNILAC